MPGGRPLKNGVDYFPLNVVMDDKFELIEAEHGIEGFGVLIKLYQKIYASNYWIKFDKKAVLVFSNRVNVNKNSINVIINSCIEWNIFDAKLFKKYEILTSKGIQKRFFEIVKRRKVVEVCNELLLIKIEVNAYKNLINVDHNSQRKGKERKGKEIYTLNFISFWKKYPRKEGKGSAFKAYQNIKNPKPTLKLILSSLKKHCQLEQWKDKQFIPHPSTWINQRRWEDELDSPLNPLTSTEVLKKHGF